MKLYADLAEILIRCRGHRTLRNAVFMARLDHIFMEERAGGKFRDWEIWGVSSLTASLLKIMRKIVGLSHKKFQLEPPQNRGINFRCMISVQNYVWRSTLYRIRIYGSALTTLPFTITNSNDELDR